MLFGLTRNKFIKLTSSQIFKFIKFSILSSLSILQVYKVTFNNPKKNSDRPTDPLTDLLTDRPIAWQTYTAILRENF